MQKQNQKLKKSEIKNTKNTKYLNKMCGQRQKASIYNIYTHIYIYARIYAISAWSSREQNQLKRRFKTCVCQNWFVSAPAKYPFSPACLVAPDLPCTVPRFLSFPSSTDNSRHSVTCKKKKRKKKQNTAAKTLNDGALQLTNRQWDRQAGEQTQ